VDYHASASNEEDAMCSARGAMDTPDSFVVGVSGRPQVLANAGPIAFADEPISWSRQRDLENSPSDKGVFPRSSTTLG